MLATRFICARKSRHVDHRGEIRQRSAAVTFATPTHIEALELGYLPEHLVVLGGGYVGLELAQAYRRFGSRVTVIERARRLMGREDGDVAAEIQRILSGEGIEFLLGAEIAEVRGKSGVGVNLVVRTESGERTIEGSDILVAAGRAPNTAGIGLSEAGVALDERGYIRVNERLETTAPDVWALGECAGSPQFTHVSEDDFRIVKDNLAGGKRSTRNRLVPYCMFTDPPLAHVGLSEGRGATRRRGGPRREDSDKRRAQGTSDLRAARLPQTSRRQRRPHPWLHHDRSRGGRGDGRGANGNAGGHAIFGNERGNSRASDYGRGTRLPPRRRTGRATRLDSASIYRRWHHVPPKATPERVSAFSDGVFAILITVLVLELRPPEQPTFKALRAALAHMAELRGQLSLHRHRLGQSPLPPALCRARPRRACLWFNFATSVLDVAAPASPPHGWP